MINLKINGKDVQAKPGMTILQVADANGIRIPRLCYHAALKPIGCCRLCVVEVKPGPPRPSPACTTPVADNMEVITHSEQLDHYRREVLQLLLVNHALDCPICDKAGECELQNLTRELKIDTQPYQAVPLVPKYDDRSPLIERYPDRCVNCERCVRICRDWVGAAALYFDNRGYRTTVTAGAHVMDCEHCGSCVAVCPTGALINDTFKYKARAWELEKQVAICPYCGGGCHIILNTKEGRLKRITSSVTEPVNGIMLCNRGRFSMDILEHPERLTQPLIRKNGSLEPVGWEEAFDFVVDRLRAVIDKHGPEAVAGVGSPRSSNEANYLFQKFCRLAIGTPHIDSAASLDHQNILRALMEGIGAPIITKEPQSEQQEGRIREIHGFPLAVGTLDDLRRADALLILGTDVKKEMTPYGWQINQAQVNNQLKNLMVVGPKKNRFRFQAQLNAYCRPGSSGQVVLGILKVLLSDSKNKELFEGFRGGEKLSVYLQGIEWAKLEAITGLATSDFQRIAQTLIGAKNPSLIVGEDATGQENSYVIGQYIANLSLIVGKKLKIHLAAEKANTQGCSDMGVSPDWLPGYVSPEKAEQFESVWKKKAPKTRGMNLRDIIGAAAGEGNRPIRGLFVLGSNLLPVLPDRERTEKALEGLEFLVCQEVFLNETAAMADCVLPALTTVETPGTLTNTEMRVQVQKGKAFCEGPKPDWEILQELSNRMGYTMNYAHAAEIFREITQVFPYYDQYPFDKIPEEGFWWQCLHLAKMGSMQWKRKFDPSLEVAVPELTPPPQPSETYPYLLALGKSLFQSGTMSRYGHGATLLEKEGVVRLHPEDAAQLGVSDGEKVTLVTHKGKLDVPVTVDHRVPRGVVQATTHFSDLQIQRITENGNLTPVRIEVKKG